MIVTCETPGCANAGVALDVAVTYPDPETGEPIPVDSVVCGVCGHPIDTDTDPDAGGV